MKTMCRPIYHHNGFLTTRTLVHMAYGSYIYNIYNTNIIYT